VSGLSEPGFEEKNAQSSSDAFVRKFGEQWTVDGQPCLHIDQRVFVIKRKAELFERVIRTGF